MVQLLLETSDLEQCCQKLQCLNISLEASVVDLKSKVSEMIGVSPEEFALVDQGGSRLKLQPYDQKEIIFTTVIFKKCYLGFSVMGS